MLTWIDANANSIREPEEIALGEVPVSIPTNTGHDLGGITLPSSLTRCDMPAWDMVAASPPASYRATTKTSVPGFAMRYEFGFQALPTTP